MASASALDLGRTIQLCKRDGRYYAAIDGLAVFGSGDAYDAAIADLDQRFGELQSFCDKSGLAPETLAPGPTQGMWRWGPALRRAAIVFACVALLTIPASYALSSALERAARDLHLRGGADFWRVRVGVGRPASTDPDIVAAYVLAPFAEGPAELRDLIERGCEAVDQIVFAEAGG